MTALLPTGGRRGGVHHASGLALLLDAVSSARARVIAECRGRRGLTASPAAKIRREPFLFDPGPRWSFPECVPGRGTSGERHGWRRPETPRAPQADPHPEPISMGPLRSNQRRLDDRAGPPRTGRAAQHAAGAVAELRQAPSGYRINSAADDAAGLGISKSMNAQVRSRRGRRAQRERRHPMAQTADGAAEQIHGILTACASSPPALGGSTARSEHRRLHQPQHGVPGQPRGDRPHRRQNW